MSNVAVRIWLVLLVSACSVCATSISGVTNGMYLALTGRNAGSSDRGSAVRWDEDLIWKVLNDKDSMEEFNYPLDPAYGVRIELRSPKGTLVEKTRAGRSFGKHWDKLRSYSDTKCGMAFAWGSLKDSPGLDGGKSIGKVKDLFVLREPGIYFLELHMQIFQLHKDPKHWSRELVQFPPVTLNIVKP